MNKFLNFMEGEEEYDPVDRTAGFPYITNMWSRI